MQNIDFYDGRNLKDIPPQPERHDAEYFSRMAKFKHKDELRNKSRASRTLFLIAALSIVSFTCGIVIGIKFAGGAERRIIDEDTFRAVTDLGTRVTGIMQDNKSVEKFKKTAFPREEFPFVIRIGKTFDKQQSQEIAGFLSSEGHTVIISKNSKKFTLFTGPYRTEEEAQDSIRKINDYTKYSLAKDTKILKRN